MLPSLSAASGAALAMAAASAPMRMVSAAAAGRWATWTATCRRQGWPFKGCGCRARKVAHLIHGNACLRALITLLWFE
jgi:hypothetical protein